MRDAEHNINETLTRVLAFLEPGGLAVIGPEEAGTLTNRALDLMQKIKEADDRIVIGLVGGTGVGKSTLINALAGREISRITAQRPTTDRPVLYRHRENDFSLDSGEEVHEHDAPGLKRISLVDFPDFDSLERDHQKTFARHFPRLDLLLWIVDPVKYADLAFYNWLALAPQARVNSLFIFNKVDEFARRYGSRAEAVTVETVRDFEAKLRRYGGTGQPEIMALSALSALAGPEGRDQPGFSALWNRLEELSEKKLRLSLKRLNLAAMVEALLEDLKTAAAPKQSRKGLEKLTAALEQGQKEIQRLIQSEGRRLLTTLRWPWRAGLASQARDRAPWPLDFFIFLWDKLTGLFSRSRAEAEVSGPLPRPDPITLNRRLTSWQAELLAAFGINDSAPGRALKSILTEVPSPEQTTDQGSHFLMLEGSKKITALARKHRWIIRHHLLPVLALVYPLLPLVFSRLFPPAAGASAAVRLDLSWRDVPPLLAAVVGLYLVETVYFAYSLDRSAGRALLELVRGWETHLTELIQKDQFEPVLEFKRRMEKEIETVETLAESNCLLPRAAGKPHAQEADLSL